MNDKECSTVLRHQLMGFAAEARKLVVSFLFPWHELLDENGKNLRIRAFYASSPVYAGLDRRSQTALHHSLRLSLITRLRCDDDRLQLARVSGFAKIPVTEQAVLMRFAAALVPRHGKHGEDLCMIAREALISAKLVLSRQKHLGDEHKDTCLALSRKARDIAVLAIFSSQPISCKEQRKKSILSFLAFEKYGQHLALQEVIVLVSSIGLAATKHGLAGDIAAESGAKVRRCNDKNKKKTNVTNSNQLKHFLQATWEELHALEAGKEHMDEQIALLPKKEVALDAAVKACRSKLDSVCRQEPLMVGEVSTVRPRS